MISFKKCIYPNYLLGSDNLLYRIKMTIDTKDFSFFLKHSGRRFKEIDDKLKLVDIVTQIQVCPNEQYTFFGEKTFVLNSEGIEEEYINGRYA